VTRLKRHALVAIGGALALAPLGGCGTTTKSGAVGDTLSGGGVNVTVVRVDHHPPVPRHDVSGLSSPAPGDGLLGVLVRVCSHVGPAIGTWDFSLALDGGGHAQVKFPSMNYARTFDDLRIGCARGWIVFEYPAGGHPSEMRFAFDDTGDSGSLGNAGGHRQETHERFSWKVA
jgi:hypothetical protein